MTSGGRTGSFLVALSVMLLLATAVQVLRDRTFAYQTPGEEVMYVSSGETMKRIALSFDDLLADIYWIRALQYYGGERLKLETANYDLLYPLLNLATTLDPRFTVGYRFGAIFLSEPHPGGAGRPDQAIALLKKGLAENPGKWEYSHDIGFIYYWNLHDYEMAAEWFNRGGDQPGAPWWLKTYAAVMLTRGGDRQASRTMWLQLRDSADNDWLRGTAQTRLLQLDALDAIDALRQALEAYAARTATRARSWQQLIAAGVLPAVPLDPTGTPYLIEAETGDVGLGPGSKLHPLPTEPSAAPELRQPR